MDLIESKSILAKLMATENLTIEQKNVSTAYFDVKNRVLVVPILNKDISSEVYDLFMGHEVGHALYTPLEGLVKSKEEKIIMSVLNVVEDSRIERKIKNKYPGLKNSFVRAYRELFEKDFFDVKDTNLNTLNFIDRVNLHCKGGAGLAIKFDETEKKLLQEVETTETFEQVVDVTKRIIDYMKSIKEKEEAFDDVKTSGFQDDDDFYEFEETDEFDEDASPSDFGAPENSESEEEEKTESSDKKKPQRSSGKGDSEEEPKEEEIVSKTDEAYRKNEKLLFSSTNHKIDYVSIPDFDIKDILDYKDVYKLHKKDKFPLAKDEFAKLRRESNKVVSYLVKEFEMRKNADQLKRASISKTGDLNMGKIFSYQFNEDIFKKITVVPGGKSHGLVMFIDWSGSMVSHLHNTVKQLLNLVFFCKKVNIPFEVYCFIENTEKNIKFKQKANHFAFDDFGIVNLLSSRMSAAEFVYAGQALMFMSGAKNYGNRPQMPWFLSMSGTPLNEAIVTAMEIVPEFQKRNKLQIVNTIFLTDGEANSTRQVYLNDDERYTRKSIGSSSSLQYDNFSVIIRDPKTKNEIKVPGTSRHVSRDMTSALIKLLKLRTESNVVGFYIASGRDFRQAISYHIQNPLLIDKIRKDRYCVVESAGFDEYYILKSEGMDTDEENEFVVKENATTRGLVSAFNKYASTRVNNRVVLNRFIDLIT